jgi:hypothetical protein
MDVENDTKYVLRLTYNEVWDFVHVLKSQCIHDAETYHILNDSKAWDENITKSQYIKYLRFLSGVIGRNDMIDYTLEEMENIHSKRTVQYLKDVEAHKIK